MRSERKECGRTGGRMLPAPAPSANLDETDLARAGGHLAGAFHAHQSAPKAKMLFVLIFFNGNQQLPTQSGAGPVRC